jgi:DNA-binding NarL/FixJ family response regulator
MKTYGNIKVAIADDHEIFRDGLRAMLQKQPDILLVAEAANGKELIELVISQEPDIVISDVKMPVMDGLTAARFIRSWYKTVKIIMLTVYDDESYLREAFELGADGYLLKNTNVAEMVDAIENVMNGNTYLSIAYLDQFKIVKSHDNKFRIE